MPPDEALEFVSPYAYDPGAGIQPQQYSALIKKLLLIAVLILATLSTIAIPIATRLVKATLIRS